MANDGINTISLMARGQTVGFDVVSKFLKVMPKRVMPKAEFYAICEPLMSGFETTHSQVVRQIGLMYEDENGYIHPRFSHEVSLSELSEYMQNCAEKYYVPNPYTQVTKSVAPLIEKPVILYQYVKEAIRSSKSQVNLQEILANVFPNLVGNNSDKVITFLDTFTDISRDGELKKWIKPLNLDSKEIPDNYKDSKAYYDYLTPKSKTLYNQQKINMNNVYRPYITAIKSKPFLLLAGISGTGKSRIVRELARSCWAVDSEEYKAQKPKNFEMVQVKPNWHDSSELIGYVSRVNGERFVVGPFLKFMVKAMQDPEHPYFLCLDEMNLAPVEQYFAEYLSVIESRKMKDGVITTDPIIDYEFTDAYYDLINQLFVDDKEIKLYLLKDGGKRLTIPQNLIVVGTVNMDETTFSFSRKVLDRAMTIEMNDVNLGGGLAELYEPIGKLGVAELVGTAVEGVDVYATNKKVCDKVIEYLKVVNDKLSGTPFKIAYRTRNEFLLYVVNNLPYSKAADGSELTQDYVMARALDEITSMKILSRIEGDESRVSKEFLTGLSNVIKAQLENMAGEEFDAEKSVSLAKLAEMSERLKNGFTSFWS